MTTTAKLDLYRERREFFSAGRSPALVHLPEANYLLTEGFGAPESGAFQEAISALYSIAYAVKFIKKRNGTDFRVPTFEAIWWSGDATTATDDSLSASRDSWRWKLLLMLPDQVSLEDVEAAKSQIVGRNARTSAVTLSRFAQGLCVQVMHLGPYDTEGESLRKIAVFIQERGLERCGPHYEVYLGDPRKAKPETLKTILRQPVRAIEGGMG